MAATAKGLGRGLDALFKNGRELEAEALVQNIPLARLEPNPQQPRRHFAAEALEELTASILSQGVLQPLLVRPIAGSTPPRYEIVAGERRFRAARKAGLAEVPVVVRELSEQEALVLALVENLQREDLNPMEEALGLSRLREEFALSQEDLAERISKSRSAIANSLRLLSLPQAAQDDLAKARYSAGHARALLMIKDPEAQEQLRNCILNGHMTVRDAELIASIWKEKGIMDLSAHLDHSVLMPRTSGTRGKGTYPSEFAELQQSLSRLLALPVRISGHEEKGRISIGFNSSQELHTLLSKLGIEEMI